MVNITATVSIGRGAHAAQSPLETLEWHRFCIATAALLESACGGTLHVQEALSVGEWNGQREESATFVAELPSDRAGVLRSGLSLLCSQYGQEAIALTLGHTEFVTP